MNMPSASEWLYSGKAFLAAMLAFYIALVIPLPNPYWSFATVYIVSHPLTGATRSKAVYRAIGTLIGAAVAVVLVPMFASRPLTLVFVMGCWSALALYLSLLNNKPSSYSFLLASYTTPLVAVSAIVAPGTIFDTAVARSEEILLGIACASVVSTVLFPARVSPVFNARVSALMKDAAAWAVRRLTDPSRRATPPLRFHLLSDIAALDGLITHLAYDATRREQAREARQIRFRMTMLIPQVASLADALHAMPEHHDGAQRCQAVLADAIAWLGDGAQGSTERGDALRRAIVTLRDGLGATTPATLPIVNAAERLRDLVDLWQDCLTLHHGFSRRDRSQTVLAYRASVPDDRVRHYDHTLMLYAAVSPAMAFVLSGWAWLYSGWPGGAGGVVMVAVATAFFASSDSPAPLVGRFLLWEAISIVAALVYLFYILPQVTTFASVVLVMAPPLLLVGTMTGRPAFNMGVLLLTSQTISGIALHNNSAANFEDFANASLGMLIGLVFAIAWSAITRPFGTEIAARRLARANWRDERSLSRRTVSADRQAALSRIVDRTAQWMPRLALTTGEALSHMDAVRDLRVCVALIDLRDQKPADAEAGRRIDEVFDASYAYFDACLDQEASLPPPRDLISAIDGAMAGLADAWPDCASALLRYKLALMALPPAAEPSSEPTHEPLTLIQP